MQKFCDALSDCELSDFGFQGYRFTWWNKRYGAELIKERLDRAVAKTKFLHLFSHTCV